MRRFWILAVVSISINICWHFLVNWLPTYLKEDRGMTFLASGMFSARCRPGGRRGQPGRWGCFPLAGWARGAANGGSDAA